MIIATAAQGAPNRIALVFPTVGIRDVYEELHGVSSPDYMLVGYQRQHLFSSAGLEHEEECRSGLDL